MQVPDIEYLTVSQPLVVSIGLERIQGEAECSVTARTIQLPDREAAWSHAKKQEVHAWGREKS